MFLVACYIYLLSFWIPHCIFLWIIKQFFKVRPPIKVIMFYVGIGTSEIVKHKNSKIIAFVSSAQVPKAFVNRSLCFDKIK